MRRDADATIGPLEQSPRLVRLQQRRLTFFLAPFERLPILEPVIIGLGKEPFDAHESDETRLDCHDELLVQL